MKIKTTPWGTIRYEYDAENRLVRKGDVIYTNDKDKEKVVRLAEELLHTQKINNGKPLKKENFRTKIIDVDNSKTGGGVRK